MQAIILQAKLVQARKNTPDPFYLFSTPTYSQFLPCKLLNTVAKLFPL